MKIERTNANVNIPFKGPRGPARPYIPTFKGAWSPGMNMYVMSGGAKAMIPPVGKPLPTTQRLNYFV